MALTFDLAREGSIPTPWWHQVRLRVHHWEGGGAQAFLDANAFADPGFSVWPAGGVLRVTNLDAPRGSGRDCQLKAGGLTDQRNRMKISKPCAFTKTLARPAIAEEESNRGTFQLLTQKPNGRLIAEI